VGRCNRQRAPPKELGSSPPTFGQEAQPPSLASPCRTAPVIRISDPGRKTRSRSLPVRPAPPGAALRGDPAPTQKPTSGRAHKLAPPPIQLARMSPGYPAAAADTLAPASQRRRRKPPLSPPSSSAAGAQTDVINLNLLVCHVTIPMSSHLTSHPQGGSAGRPLPGWIQKRYLFGPCNANSKNLSAGVERGELEWGVSLCPFVSAVSGLYICCFR